MYRIKRHYQVAEKQPWLIDLLVKLKPSYFAPCQGIEECKLALHNLGEDIKKQELSWKRGKFLLSYIRDITEKDDEIITYCTVGIRSGFAAEILKMVGYSKVKNYNASFSEWAGSGNSYEK